MSTKLGKMVIMAIAAVLLLASVSFSTTFTMDGGDLVGLYELSEYGNINFLETELLSVQATPYGCTPFGAKYSGNLGVYTLNTSVAMEIGARSSGTDFDGAGGLMTTENVIGTTGTSGTGFGDLSGFSEFTQIIFNVDENSTDDIDHTWNYQLFLEDSSFVRHTTAWVPLLAHASDVFSLDLTALPAGFKLDDISEIGFAIQGVMPLTGDDITFETKIEPVPEPASMLLFGSGLLGLGIAGRRLKKNIVVNKKSSVYVFD